MGRIMIKERIFHVLFVCFVTLSTFCFSAGPARAADELPAFLKDTKLNLHVRTFYYNRDYEDGGGSEAWAGGGWLEYKSGWAADLFQIQAAVFTSQPIHAPEDKDGTRLLAPGQEAITVLGLANLRIRLIEGTELILYRQYFDLPYLNRRDSRMIPNTFEAYTLESSSIKNLKITLAHVTKIKHRDSNTFDDMYEGALLTGDSEGNSLAALRYNYSEDMDMGFVNHYTWDYMNTFYADANVNFKLGSDVVLGLSAQFTDQRSVGDELDGDFKTWVGGGQFKLSWKGASLRAAFTVTGDGAEISNPYGGYPGYCSLMVEDFYRAEEKAWLLGLSYDFSNIGLNGLIGKVDYARGYTPDTGVNASPDQDELDITFDYRPSVPIVEGFWIRVRAAFVDQQDGAALERDIEELHVVLNFDLNIL